MNRIYCLQEISHKIWLRDINCNNISGFYHVPFVILYKQSLSETCPCSKLFWSAFSCIWTEYERYYVSLRIQPKFGKIWTRITPNTDTFYTVNISDKFWSGFGVWSCNNSSHEMKRQWFLCCKRFTILTNVIGWL